VNEGKPITLNVEQLKLCKLIQEQVGQQRKETVQEVDMLKQESVVRQRQKIQQLIEIMIVNL
jgi:hypothetical protein